MVNDPSTRDVDTYLGQLFRRRFRIPAPFFIDWLVPKCRVANIFPTAINKNGTSRRQQIPIEVKILLCLRLLGRGVTFDDVAEPSGVSETHCTSIFVEFVVNFTSYFKEEFVRLPDPNELKLQMDVYAALGFPGCVGSCDCTHIRWWQCPARLQNLCRGKETYPTIGFHMMVDHSKRILYVSDSFFGRLNDQNICDVDR